MQYFERVYIDSCPDIDLFIFDVDLCLIDRDRLPSVAVGLEEVLTLEERIMKCDEDCESALC